MKSPLLQIFPTKSPCTDSPISIENALNHLSLEEYAVYVMIYSKVGTTNEDIYRISKESKEYIDSLIERLSEKGWVNLEVVS